VEVVKGTRGWIAEAEPNDGETRRSIMEPAGGNPDLVFLYLIDEPMFLINASRPTTGQFVLQRLGLAQTGKRVTLNFTNQPHDSKRLRPVLLDPLGEILEGR
jgi:hypothetical protein